MTLVSGLPDFLLDLGTSAGRIGLYLLIYTLATAHNELALIRRDVTAAAVALGDTGEFIPASHAAVRAAHTASAATFVSNR